jgi:histidinol dehydrogenase
MRISALSQDSLTRDIEALRPPASSEQAVRETVAGLLADVRDRGDVALAEATARLDWPEATAATLRVPVEDLQSAYREVDPATLEALRVARDNCMFFHQHELRPDWQEEGPQGQRLGIRYVPVERAGLYVPGGLGAYASTVIMNVVPAQVAGVAGLVLCTPPGRDGRVNESVLAAAWLMGIRQVFRVGGAQAVAAMAYGTATVPRVDVICGPGNVYVMEAKRQVFGTVGIDSLAGPSEVLVVADETARPEWIAADLLAQEEHGSGATGVLMAQSESLCARVREAVLGLRERRGGRAEDEMEGGGSSSPGSSGGATGPPGLRAFYPSRGEDFVALASRMVDEYAPEHLEIQMSNPWGFLSRVRYAGAIFVGHGTPTAFGDYVAGSNHVLPTGGSARFASPLSVDTFVRASSLVEMTDDAARRLTPHLARLADDEGFALHRVSAEIRVEDMQQGGRETADST